MKPYWLLRDVLAAYALIIGLVLLIGIISPLRSVWGLAWPMLILIPGLVLSLSALGQPHYQRSHERYGFVLVLLAILLFINIITGWNWSKYFLLQLGVVLLVPLWLMHARRFSTLNPPHSVKALMVVAAFDAILVFHWQYFIWPLLLIALGLILIRRPRRIRDQ